MTPQHVVEHLAMTLTISNGKNPKTLMVPEETAKKVKAVIIDSPAEIGQGIKSPLLGDEPPPYVHDSLTSAIIALKTELEDFDSYFKLHPDAKLVQHRMGELRYDEWVILHNKHFTHHLKQFGLIV